MATIALDIGGTKIASAIFFPDGSMMFNRKRLLKGRTGHEVGKLAADILAKLLTVARRSRIHVDGIGVCIPGIVYSQTNRVWAPNIPGWDNYPLYEELRSVTPPGIEIYIDSDRTCYMYGEMWQGAAKECHSAIFIAVGTGIGAGIIIDGTCCTEPTTLSAPPAGWPCNLPTGKSMTHADVSNITLPAMVSGHGYAMPYAPTSHIKENCARNPSVAYRPMMCSVPIMKKTLLPSPYCTKLSRCGAWLPQIWSAYSTRRR